MWPGAWAVLSCRAPVRRGSTTRLAKGGGGTRVVAAGPVAAPGGAASRRAYDTNTCLRVRTNTWRSGGEGGTHEGGAVNMAAVVRVSATGS